jgi:hypothetical protein
VTQNGVKSLSDTIPQNLQDLHQKKGSAAENATALATKLVIAEEGKRNLK